MLDMQPQSFSLDTHRATAPSTASLSLSEALYTKLSILGSLQVAHETLRFSDVPHGCSGRPHQPGVPLRHQPSAAVWQTPHLVQPRTPPPRLLYCQLSTRRCPLVRR